jgi:hypothetical protein
MGSPLEFDGSNRSLRYLTRFPRLKCNFVLLVRFGLYRVSSETLCSSFCERRTRSTEEDSQGGCPHKTKAPEVESIYRS